MHDICALLFVNPTRVSNDQERTPKRDGQTDGRTERHGQADRQTERQTTKLKTICLPILWDGNIMQTNDCVIIKTVKFSSFYWSNIIEECFWLNAILLVQHWLCHISEVTPLTSVPGFTITNPLILPRTRLTLPYTSCEGKLHQTWRLG